MPINPLILGNITTENNLFLAPMAGFTDYPFRSVITDMGVGLAFTELTSAKGLYFGGKNNFTLLKSDNYDKTAAQIFGSDPYFMRWACESDYLKDYKIVDINMGCPVPKVVKNGDGSALLDNLPLAVNIVKECVKSGKIITVKIRTGIKRGDDLAETFCKGLEDAGASLISIHGRVREDYYTGEIDYKAIYRAKRAVNIPIIANGGIFTVKDAEKTFTETGADGIMIARGAIADPFLFCKIQNKEPKNGIKSLAEFAILHLKREAELFGEQRACVEFRKFLPYYYKKTVNSKEIRSKIMKKTTCREISEIIAETL